MSTISHREFTAALDRWGVDYVEHSRHDRCLGRTVPWHEHEARRGRDCARRGWDAHGIAVHHSGGPTSWQFVWDGRSDVPGPLYTAIIYPDGTAHLTGWRITNNVGRCDATVRNRVLRGDMPTSGGNVDPGADDYVAANSEFYGIAYRGTEPNNAQRRTGLLMCAAICDAHGGDWDGGSVAGHKELTERKPDPEGENMSAFRRDVNDLLDSGPGGSMSWSENLGDNMSNYDEELLPNSWSKRADYLQRKAAGALAFLRHRKSSRPRYPDDPAQSLWWFIRWGWWNGKTARLEIQREVKPDVKALRSEVGALRGLVETLASGQTGLTEQQIHDAVATALQENVLDVNVDVTLLPDDEDDEPAAADADT